MDGMNISEVLNVLLGGGLVATIVAICTLRATIRKAEKLRSGERFFDGCDFRNISSLVKRWEPVFMGVIGEKFIRSIRWRTSPPH